MTVELSSSNANVAAAFLMRGSTVQAFKPSVSTAEPNPTTARANRASLDEYVPSVDTSDSAVVSPNKGGVYNPTWRMPLSAEEGIGSEAPEFLSLDQSKIVTVLPRTELSAKFSGMNNYAATIRGNNKADIFYTADADLPTGQRREVNMAQMIEDGLLGKPGNNRFYYERKGLNEF